MNLFVADDMHQSRFGGDDFLDFFRINFFKKLDWMTDSTRLAALLAKISIHKIKIFACFSHQLHSLFTTASQFSLVDEKDSICSKL